jgi:hypothetical protein
MPSQVEIIPNVGSLLARRSGHQVHFNDVFSEATSQDNPTWWQNTDFDAALTVLFKSTAPVSYQPIPIGIRPWFVSYGLVLLDDLVGSNSDHSDKLSQAPRLHADERAELELSRLATVAVANFAPRDDAHTRDNQNGEDFFLAVTTSGLEIYVTPLSFLSGLAKRNRIRALYRIPTANHPEFNGDDEQFRSAVIARSRRHPDHLVPVYQYSDTPALSVAKLTGTHEEIIPTDIRSGHIAFVDKFGNVKLEEPKISRLGNMAVGREVGLQIIQDGKRYELPVYVAKNLHSAPSETLVIYQNCSDRTANGEDVGFVELMTRVNDENPSTTRKTTMFKLLELIPDLDISRADVKIII